MASPLRIALVSDVHGNAVALEAVLEDVRRAGVDEVLCLGDVATLGPSPVEAVRIIRERGCRSVMGNHDQFLLEPELVRAYTQAPEILEAVDWCREALSEEDLELFRPTPMTMAMDLGAGGTLLACHGSPRSTTDDILATTPAPELDALLAGHDETLVACGHTHIQMLRQHRGALVVNPGSVGMPFEEYVGGGTPTLLPHAEYAVVEASPAGISVDLRRVAVDRDALVRSAESSDCPLRGFLISQWR